VRGSGGSEYLASLVEVSASFSLACFSFSLFPSLIFALPLPLPSHPSSLSLFTLNLFSLSSPPARFRAQF